MDSDDDRKCDDDRKFMSRIMFMFRLDGYRLANTSSCTQ